MGFIIIEKYAIIIYHIFFYEFTVVENILITMNYNLKKKNQSNKWQTPTHFVSFYVQVVYTSTKKASSTIWSIYFILQNIRLILCNISKFTILQQYEILNKFDKPCYNIERYIK